MRIQVLVGLVLALTVSGGVAKADPWEGVWAGDLSWCKNKPSETDQVPMKLSKKGAEGYESACGIPKVTQITGMRAWLVVSKCSGEGETYTSRELLLLTEADKLIRFSEDGHTVEMVRCKR